MHFLLRSLSTSLRHTYHHRYHQNYRNLYDAASTTTTKWVRDRGLDHAVLREKNLKPVINLKNLIKSEPSKSVPLSIITSSNDSLQIPIRPIEFIRKYRSIFEEFFPGNITIHPHVKLSSEALNLDVEENLLYESVNYKQDIADRLLKLLMIGRINKIPLSILDKIKWELGLPQDYVRSIVPEFPDYFTVSKGNVAGSDEMLELVCWSNECAVSFIEKKAKKDKKGPGIEFPLKYTPGFEMDKKDKKWVDEWQKLPYISPYENAMPLELKNDDSDKWAVAVLHEILNLFVGKKAEKESVLYLGEFFGLRSRFKRAMLQHPGIFYVSSKNWMHTVVLRDGYKRGALNEKDILMDMRFKYARLMNTVKEEDKGKGVQKKATSHKPIEGEGDEELVDNSSEEDEDEEMCDMSNEDTDEDYENDNDDDEDDEEDSDDENAKNKRPSNEKSSRNLRRSSAGPNPREDMDGMRPRFSRTTYGDVERGNNRGRSRNKTTFEENRGSRNSRRSSTGANPREGMDGRRPGFSRTRDGDGERANNKGRGRNETTFEENRGSRNLRRSSTGANPREGVDGRRPGFSRMRDGDGERANNNGRVRNETTFEENRGSRNSQRSSTRANPREGMDGRRPGFSRRTDGDDSRAKHRGRQSNNRTFEDKKGSSDLPRSSETNSGKTEEGTRPRFSRKTDRDGQNAHGRSKERLQVPRCKG